MADSDLKGLYGPFTVRGMRFKSRFVMPAMSRGWGKDGRPSPLYADYFGRRVDGGVGLVITEACAVPHASASCQPQISIITPDSAADWRPITDRVHASGGKIFLQLWHEGAIRQEGTGPFPDTPSLSPSGLLQKDRTNGRAATITELEEIRDAFVSAALTAQDAGFDGVEVHGAHGYFLDLFLWAETNLRSDRYGGSTLLDRLRYPAEIVAAIRAAVRPDFIVGYRFSQWKEVDYETNIIASPEELGQFLAAFKAAGADIFHVSTRRFWDAEWEGSDLGLAGWAKKLTDVPVIAVGSVGLSVDLMTGFIAEAQTFEFAGEPNLEALAARFSRGDFDLIAVGRSLIGDADWVNKIARRDYDSIRSFTKKDVMGNLEWDPGFVGETYGVDTFS